VRGRSPSGPTTVLLLGSGLLLLAAVVAFWVDAVLDLVLPVVALGVVVAVSPERRARRAAEAAIVAVLATGLLLAGWSWAVALIVTVQVALVIGLAEAIAQRLSAIRAAQQQAARAAQRRGALLEAVRDLPRGDVAQAETAVVRTLRLLGFDAAGAARIAGDVLVEGALDGLQPLEVPLRRGEGVAWQAIEQDRTIVLTDYETAPYSLASRAGIRGMVITPIRVAGRPVGVLSGLREAPERPDAAEVEVAEVMAAHLGSVLENQGSLERQQLLLEQAEHLDRISQSLLEAISEEVRDPLTVLRLGAQLLSEHGADLTAEQRTGLLSRVRRESDALRLILDTILDFSRYHGRRVEPRPAPVALERLLAACDLAVEDGVAGSLTVEVDLELLLPAIRLLLASGQHDGATSPPVTIAARDDAVVITLPGTLVGPRSSVLVQLAEQLLHAAGARLGSEGGGETAALHLDVRHARVEVEGAP